MCRQLALMQTVLLRQLTRRRIFEDETDVVGKLWRFDTCTCTLPILKFFYVGLPEICHFF